MGEWRYSYTILDLGTRWSGQLHAQAALPWGKSPGWVGPRACLDAVGKGKKSGPCRESDPGRPARGYTDRAIPTPGNTEVTQWVPK
jgi:hypothetical protein